MSVALRQGILKCVSTDTVREVMRTYDQSPAIMRSSYQGDGDPIVDWNACCEILQTSVDALVFDAMKRGVSLVLEGVHIRPSNILLDKWRENGGKALGCLLTITDATAHKSLIYKRGEITKKGEDKKIKAFSRIRTIQEEMIRMAQINSWLMIEQRLAPDPLELVTSLLTDSEWDVGT